MLPAKDTTAIVALIRASTCEPVDTRREAAGMLLDVLRSAPGKRELREDIARIEAENGRDVTEKVVELVEQLSLGGPADLLP